MDAATAAKVKPGDILPYPEGWPRTGPNTLVEPCEVFAARDCPFSESGRILYLHGVSGKTIELDASWFLPPARLKPPETVVFVSNEETKKQASEWEF